MFPNQIFTVSEASSLNFFDYTGFDVKRSFQGWFVCLTELVFVTELQTAWWILMSGSGGWVPGRCGKIESCQVTDLWPHVNAGKLDSLGVRKCSNPVTGWEWSIRYCLISLLIIFTPQLLNLRCPPSFFFIWLTHLWSVGPGKNKH